MPNNNFSYAQPVFAILPQKDFYYIQDDTETFYLFLLETYFDTCSNIQSIRITDKQIDWEPFFNISLLQIFHYKILLLLLEAGFSIQSFYTGSLLKSFLILFTILSKISLYFLIVLSFFIKKGIRTYTKTIYSICIYFWKKYLQKN